MLLHRAIMFFAVLVMMDTIVWLFLEDIFLTHPSDWIRFSARIGMKTTTIILGIFLWVVLLPALGS